MPCLNAAIVNWSIDLYCVDIVEDPFKNGRILKSELYIAVQMDKQNSRNTKV